MSGLPHLSEDAVAAYADGVLSAAAASRAQRHCAECAECADAVRGQREAAMMLRASPAPALPSGLLDRLSGLPMSAPLPPPRSGLPTMLGADGVAMFVAHDVHRAGPSAGRDQTRAQPQVQPPDQAQSEPQPSTQPSTQPQPPTQPQPRPAHRRALPMTVLASAAAVVAAGTFGGHVSTLAAAADRQARTGSANAADSLTGGQAPGARSVSPLAGAGSLLPVSRTSAGTAPDQAGTAPDQAGAVTVAADGQVSLTLAPLRGPAHQGSAAAVHRSWVTGPAARAAQHVEWRPTGFAAPMTGMPIATP